MEFHQLRYFVAVAELGSFTKAAERCLVAQPSLSQQIIKLEKELGQPLLERLGRSIRLTDAGRSLYEQATSILAALEEAKKRVASTSGEQSGMVAVGAIPTIAPYLLPSLVCEFRQQFPLAHIVIHEDLTEHTVENCLRGELDVGVLALPIEEPHLHVEPLFEEELLLALPVEHPLATKDEVTIHDLNGEAFILLNEMHCLGQQIVSFCNKESCIPYMACRSAQLLTIQQLVSVGHGISLLPALACELDNHPHRLYRRLSGPAPTRTLALIWHKERYQRPIVRRFIDLVRTKAGLLATRLRTEKK